MYRLILVPTCARIAHMLAIASPIVDELAINCYGHNAKDFME